MTSEPGAGPVAEFLDLPDGYGRATRMLAWATVSAMLEESRQYWLATVRAGSRPHVVPLDGIWLDDVWYYGGSPDTVHAQAVLANPHAVLHLPDPWKVVVVEGEVRRVKPDDATAQRLADLSSVKYPDYGIDYTPDLYAEVSAFRPVHAVAWTSFPQDATRFRWSA